MLISVVLSVELPSELFRRHTGTNRSESRTKKKKKKKLLWATRTRDVSFDHSYFEIVKTRRKETKTTDFYALSFYVAYATARNTHTSKKMENTSFLRYIHVDCVDLILTFISSADIEIYSCPRILYLSALMDCWLDSRPSLRWERKRMLSSDPPMSRMDFIVVRTFPRSLFFCLFC